MRSVTGDLRESVAVAFFMKGTGAFNSTPPMSSACLGTWTSKNVCTFYGAVGSE